MVIIRGQHLAIGVQEMEFLPLAIVMVSANGIGESTYVFPTGNAEMKNVLHCTQTVEQISIANLMRNAMLKNVFQRTKLQHHVKVKLFTRHPPKNKIALGITFVC